MKIHPVGAVPCGQGMDMMKLTDTFCNFANTPKNLQLHLYVSLVHYN